MTFDIPELKLKIAYKSVLPCPLNIALSIITDVNARIYNINSSGYGNLINNKIGIAINTNNTHPKITFLDVMEITLFRSASLLQSMRKRKTDSSISIDTKGTQNVDILIT